MCLRNPLLLDREVRMCHVPSYPTSSRFVPLVSFPAAPWISDGARGTEHSFTWPAVNHLPPFTAEISGSTPLSGPQKTALSPEAREGGMRVL